MTTNVKPVNLVYFGSPDFSGEILKQLLDHPLSNIKVVAVVTNPDKETGRLRILTSTPVAQVADRYHLPIFKPLKLDDSNLTHLKLLNPDIFLVVAYGKIIPLTWLKTPSHSTLNVHFSLLPKYRGALCIQEAIKNQDSVTGVTLMEMDEQLDHGPIISQAIQEISQNDDVTTLTQKLTQKAITLLYNAFPQYLTKQIAPQPQDHTQATFTPSYKSLTHTSAFVPWSQITNDTQSIKTHALICSLNPQPGAWTKIPTLSGEVEAKILHTQINPNTKTLEILTIQLPGRPPISWKQFLAGHPLKT